jgi:hypothetical protein
MAAMITKMSNTISRIDVRRQLIPELSPSLRELSRLFPLKK